jgi:hypothetical protein
VVLAGDLGRREVLFPFDVDIVEEGDGGRGRCRVLRRTGGRAKGVEGLFWIYCTAIGAEGAGAADVEEMLLVLLLPEPRKRGLDTLGRIAGIAN